LMREGRMEIQQQLMMDLKQALRDRDELRKSTVRMALAALKNARVDKNADLTRDEEVAVLSYEVKQRRDAIDEYAKGGRDDLVAEGKAEIEILMNYLPKMLERAEVVALAREAMAEVGASDPKQLGQVMRVLMPRVKGRADGRMVNEVVRELLSDR
jgi:uncharacterized protein YqeY